MDMKNNNGCTEIVKRQRKVLIMQSVIVRYRFSYSDLFSVLISGLGS